MANELAFKIEDIKKLVGSESSLIVKNFYIGKGTNIEAAILYIYLLSDKEIIIREILNPLMLKINEDLNGIPDLADYLTKKYIPMGGTTITKDINYAVMNLKKGRAVLVINYSSDIIVFDTTGGKFRTPTEPVNETAIMGAREGFIENLETNISLLKRRIKDKNLKIEYFIIGRRSQKDLALVYIDDVVNKEVLNNFKDKISKVDIDCVTGIGMFGQLIEPHPYSVFPQAFGSERIDVIEASIVEGRIAVILDGSPSVRTIPCLFVEYFQAIDDYNERSYVASFSRILRFIATFIVITMPSIYLTLLKFNIELIPIKFIAPIIQSRKGIALPPFLEILSMELFIELLREGGLRLPTKVAQTLSVVGGIIIGEMAVRSRIISPSTLFILGITTIATFLIPFYDMSLAIRLIRFPILIASNFLGIFGISASLFFLLTYLSAMDSYGVPYFSLSREDMKDTLIRGQIFKMNKRPEGLYTQDMIRMTDFRNKFRRKH